MVIEENIETGLLEMFTPCVFSIRLFVYLLLAEALVCPFVFHELRLYTTTNTTTKQHVYNFKLQQN